MPKAGRGSKIAKAKEILEPLTERPRRMKCLFPNNHKHGDRRPSATLYRDGYKCFGCGIYLDSLDYYCLTENLSVSAALAQLGVTTPTPVTAQPRNEAMNKFIRESIDAPGIAPFREGVGRG